MSLENTVRTLGYRITDLKRRLETRISTDETNLADHLADTTDAHDASAISIADAGAYFSGTDVEAVTQDLGSRVDALESPSWTTLSLASANWTIDRTMQWRQEGDRIFLRGHLTRINSGFGASGTFFTLGSGNNPPTPSSSQNMPTFIQEAAGTWNPVSLYLDTTGPYVRTTSLGPTIDVTDRISFDGLSYYL